MPSQHAQHARFHLPFGQPRSDTDDLQHPDTGTVLLEAKPLTAREAYQILRDIALGVRSMRRLGQQSWAEIYCGLMTVEADGWVLTFYNDCDTLDYCDSCYSPEGRAYLFDSLQSYSTDPVELLSTWECAQLEKLLSVA